MDNFDIFLNPKGESFLKDDSIDILDGESWCLENDKLWNGQKYSLEDVEIDTNYDVDVDLNYDCELDSSQEMLSYAVEGEDPALSPCSASSSASLASSSDQYEENPNVKVVQLVGILPAGVKSIQIVQEQQNQNQTNQFHHQQISLHQNDDIISESIETSSTSSSSNSNDNSSYQELKLSDEEKRLLSKEGISLPSHYPLTKYEERELKRIRRKIRNKISAQDSRKRKKEYLDKLQQKVQEVEDEKTILAKKVRTLETANSRLSQQVKRLQMALTNATNKQNNSGTGSNTSVVPAATTLLVVILSLALVVLPTMQNKSKQNDVENAIMSAFDDSNPNTSMVRSRTMLGVSMPNGKVKPSSVAASSSAGAYDDLDDLDDEPLVKIPRFSFQTPNGGNGAGMMGSKIGIHSGQQQQQHIMIGVDGVENKMNIGSGSKIAVKGGVKRPFQHNEIIDDMLDI